MPNRVKHQAIPLYTSDETLFNDNTSIYQWHEDYFPLVTCDDTSQIIINNEVSIYDVGVDSEFDFVSTGTITSVTGTSVTIEDTAAEFITQGVQAGMYFMRYSAGVNSKTDKGLLILSVDSETQITLALASTFVNGDYYEISAWIYVGDVRTVNGYAQIENTAPTVSSSGLETVIKDDTVYRVQFTVTYIDPDAPASNIYVTLGNNQILKVFAEDIEAKEYTAYGLSDDTDFTLVISGNPIINIDSVVISEMYKTSFEIKECSTDVVKYTSDIDDIIYAETTNQLRMDVEWVNAMDGYDCEGCYYIDVTQATDPNEDLDRINDGDFDFCTDWNVGDGWSCGFNSSDYSGSASGGVLSQTDLFGNFNEGEEYDVGFEFDSNNVNGVTVGLYKTGSLVLDLGTYTVSQVYLVSTGVLTDHCDEIRFTPVSEIDLFSIYSVSAIRTSTSTQFQYRTNCFELTDNLGSTVKLSGSNNDNAFGIDFNGLNYSPFIRVKGELNTPKWDGDKENEEDSLGISKTLYFKSETNRDLFLYQLPLFHHDFIRLLIGYDTLLVDDIEYIAKNGGYEPESERNSGKLSDLNNSNTSLRLETDFNVNKFC